MNIRNFGHKVLRGLHFVTEFLVWVAYVALVAIVLIVCIDVGGRYFLNSPLIGAFELVQLGMLVLGGVAVLYTAEQKGHVAVEVLITRFRGRAQIIMQIIFLLLGFGTWGLLAYQIFLYALEVIQLATLTDILEVPLGPFLVILAFSLALCSLTLLMQAFQPVPEGTLEQKREAASE